VPDFDSERDIVLLERQRDILFSRERWVEIAQSIGLAEIPREMKRDIANVFFESLVSDEQSSARQRRARQRKGLKTLVSSLQEHSARLSKLQRQLGSEEIIYRVKELIEQVDVVKVTAKKEMSRTMSKGGRPRKIIRTQMAHRLLDIYAKYTGNPIRLSRDSRNRPSGPCYRFLWRMFEASHISTTGLAYVIEQKRPPRHAKNALSKRS
jgi:hypothetical protein